MAGVTTRQNPIPWLTDRPIAHRGLHDADAGIFENTLSAAGAAVAKHYSIEVDLHLASDGVPVVFHDQTLDRLTGEKGNTRERSASELGQIRIGGSGDTIPTLQQLLDMVDGKSTLVLELKGVAGADGDFALAVAEVLKTYSGPVAVMSFNHWLLRDMRQIAPDLTLGLTAEGNEKLADVHRSICEETGPDFLSYKMQELDTPFVGEFRETRPVICWTVKTPEQASWSLERCDQITFEGFLA